jgi:hypothetical protein
MSLTLELFAPEPPEPSDLALFICVFLASVILGAVLAR